MFSLGEGAHTQLIIRRSRRRRLLGRSLSHWDLDFSLVVAAVADLEAVPTAVRGRSVMVAVAQETTKRSSKPALAEPCARGVLDAATEPSVALIECFEGLNVLPLKIQAVVDDLDQLRR